jgi:hypothetical protein
LVTPFPIKGRPEAAYNGKISVSITPAINAINVLVGNSTGQQIYVGGYLSVIYSN